MDWRRGAIVTHGSKVMATNRRSLYGRELTEMVVNSYVAVNIFVVVAAGVVGAVPVIVKWGAHPSSVQIMTHGSQATI